MNNSTSTAWSSGTSSSLIIAIKPSADAGFWKRWLRSGYRSFRRDERFDSVSPMNPLAGDSQETLNLGLSARGELPDFLLSPPANTVIFGIPWNHFAIVRRVARSWLRSAKQAANTSDRKALKIRVSPVRFRPRPLGQIRPRVGRLPASSMAGVLDGLTPSQARSPCSVSTSRRGPPWSRCSHR